MTKPSASRNGWVPSNDYGTTDTPGEQDQGLRGGASFGFILFTGVLPLVVRVYLAVPENDFLLATF